MKFDCLGEGISIRFQPENISSDEKTKKLRSDIAQIVCSYEEKSKTVCENCGQTGNMRMDMPWKRTLCDDCYENYLQKIKAKK